MLKICSRISASNGQSFEFLEILLDVWNTRARPIGAKQRFVGNLLEPRKILQQRLRRNAADVEIDVGMPPDEKKRSVHPERPPAVCQQDLELGEIDRDIVNVDRISILVARAGEDRCPGVKHDGNSIGLGGAVDDFELLHSVQIIVRKQAADAAGES